MTSRHVETQRVTAAQVTGRLEPRADRKRRLRRREARFTETVAEDPRLVGRERFWNLDASDDGSVRR